MRPAAVAADHRARLPRSRHRSRPSGSLIPDRDINADGTERAARVPVEVRPICRDDHLIAHRTKCGSGARSADVLSYSTPVAGEAGAEERAGRLRPGGICGHPRCHAPQGNGGARPPDARQGRAGDRPKGQYLVIEDEEIDAIEIESTHVIEIDRWSRARLRCMRRARPQRSHGTSGCPATRSAGSVVRARLSARDAGDGVRCP
jgi:hypothetical protein